MNSTNSMNSINPTKLKKLLLAKYFPHYLLDIRDYWNDLPADVFLIDDKRRKFLSDYWYLNFHPILRERVEEYLHSQLARFKRTYHTPHQIGSFTSSQALCWNVILPMKKFEYFNPLFNMLNQLLEKEGADKFDFGVDTKSILEYDVASLFGERKRLGTSIDLFLRTASGKIACIEFKFTENDFGHCIITNPNRPIEKRCEGYYGTHFPSLKKEGNYLCYLSSLGRPYWKIGSYYNLLDPTFIANVNEKDLEKRCPLNIYYQPLRNLMVAKHLANERPKEEIRGIFVLIADGRNNAFFGKNGEKRKKNRFDRFKEYLKQTRFHNNIPDVYCIAIQDLIAHFDGPLECYKQYLFAKYFNPL